MKHRGIIVVNPEKCVACRTCEIQCAVAHSKSKKLEEAICEVQISAPRINVGSVLEAAIPLQCRHCEDAPCVEACPTKAIDRPDKESPVLINSDKCVGCKMCILVCPFGVINMNKKGKAILKCDLCFERLEKGEKPACVSGCPTHAIEFKEVTKVPGKKKYLVKFKGKENI